MAAEITQAAALLGAGLAAIGGIGSGIGQGVATGYAVEAISFRSSKILPILVPKFFQKM